MHHSIREATALDLLLLAELGEDYESEVQNHTPYPIDIEKAMQSAFASIISPDSVIYLAFDGNKPVGFFWGSMANFVWSGQKIATDHLLYVSPNYRGGNHGYRLLKAYEKWATEKGAKAINISVASGITTERTGRFYEAMGYSPIAKQYRKEI